MLAVQVVNIVLTAFSKRKIGGEFFFGLLEFLRQIDIKIVIIAVVVGFVSNNLFQDEGARIVKAIGDAVLYTVVIPEIDIARKAP